LLRDFGAAYPVARVRQEAFGTPEREV